MARGVPRPHRRHQVRRPRDGRRRAAAGVRRGHGVPAVRRACARSSCTAAARRSPRCSTGSASRAVFAAVCGSPPRRRSTSSAWCSSGRSSPRSSALINEHGPFAVGLSGEDGACSPPSAPRRSSTASRSTSAWSATSSPSTPAPCSGAARGRPHPGRLQRRPRRPAASSTTSTPTPPPPRSPSRCGAEKLVVLTDVEGLYADWPDRDSLVEQIARAASWPRSCPTLDAGMVPKMAACLRAVRGRRASARPSSTAGCRTPCCWRCSPTRAPGRWSSRPTEPGRHRR